MPVVNYLWDPVEDNIIEELDDAGTSIAEYTTEPELYGNVISQYRQGEYRQFHYDAQGSTLAVTGNNQQVTDTRAYSAFGEATEASGSSIFPFHFAGRLGYYHTGHGHYSIRTRTYVAALQRWLSRDPRATREHNEYWYSDNCPTHLGDPSGLLTETLNMGLLSNGPCARYTAFFHWDPSPEEVDGYIIQCVRLMPKPELCNPLRGPLALCNPPNSVKQAIEAMEAQGLVNTGGNCTDNHYCELWTVDSEGVVCEVAPHVCEGADLFTHFGFESPGTKGRIDQSGESFFIKRSELTAAQLTRLDVLFKQGSAGGVANAGILRSACYTGPVSALLDEIKRDLPATRFSFKSITKKWNCCDCDSMEGLRMRESSLFISYGGSPPIETASAALDFDDKADDAPFKCCTDC